jgi:hypothetical protein
LLRRVLDELSGDSRPAHWSVLRAILADSQVLPELMWRPAIVGRRDRRPLPRPGAWLEEVGIAVEVEAAEGRIAADEWEGTMRRHNQWARYGVLVMYFSAKRIREDPMGVRREVEQAYLDRLRTGVTASVEIST